MGFASSIASPRNKPSPQQGVRRSRSTDSGPLQRVERPPYRDGEFSALEPAQKVGRRENRFGQMAAFANYGRSWPEANGRHGPTADMLRPIGFGLRIRLMRNPALQCGKLLILGGKDSA